MAGAWGASWGAAFGGAFGLLVPSPGAQVPGGHVGAGATIRGKRRTLTQDPYLRKLQKQFEENAAADAASATAPENHIVDATNMVQASVAAPAQRPKRTRAQRENEFFALMH